MPLPTVSTTDQDKPISEILEDAEQAYQPYRYDTEWKSFCRGFIEGRKELEANR